MVADHQNGKVDIIRPLEADALVFRRQGAQQQAHSNYLTYIFREVSWQSWACASQSSKQGMWAGDYDSVYKLNLHPSHLAVPPGQCSGPMQGRELLPALVWGALSMHYLPALMIQPTSSGYMTMPLFRDFHHGHELVFSYTS